MRSVDENSEAPELLTQIVQVYEGISHRRNYHIQVTTTRMETSVMYCIGIKLKLYKKK